MFKYQIAQQCKKQSWRDFNWIINKKMKDQCLQIECQTHKINYRTFMSALKMLNVKMLITNISIIYSTYYYFTFKIWISSHWAPSHLLSWDCRACVRSLPAANIAVYLERDWACKVGHPQRGVANSMKKMARHTWWEDYVIYSKKKIEKLNKNILRIFQNFDEKL